MRAEWLPRRLHRRRIQFREHLQLRNSRRNQFTRPLCIASLQLIALHINSNSSASLHRRSCHKSASIETV